MFVVTFYSYKGGVGRTSALMNTADRLASKGKTVLVVDFDLEAPGIDAFGELVSEEPRKGVVEYITRFLETGKVAPIGEFIYRAKLRPNSQDVLIFPAGRKDNQYQSDLSRLDWKVLYKQRKGFLFIENLRASLKQEFSPDYVLIDSRTGLTDISGICTLQLPNLVVMLFSLNNQNLNGTGQILRSIRFNKINRLIYTLLVASPVPDVPDSVSLRKDRLEAARKLVGAPADLLLPYDQFVPFQEMILTGQETALSKAYDALADRIVAMNQSDVLTMLQEAKQLKDKGNVELAELRFREIIESKPSSVEGWLEFGTFMRMRGRFAEAAKYFEQALQIAPTNCEALAQQASNLLSMKKTGAATESLKRLLSVSSKEHNLLIEGVVNLFTRYGALDAAEEGYRYLIQREGGIQNFVGLGEIYMRLHRYREALEVYKAGLALSPTNLPCVYNAGHALQRMGQHDLANELYKRATDLFEQMDKSTNTPVWVANSFAAMSFAYAAIGKPGIALQMLANAINIARSLEKVQIFSPITYAYISREEFIKQLGEMSQGVRSKSLQGLNL